MNEVLLDTKIATPHSKQNENNKVFQFNFSNDIIRMFDVNDQNAKHLNSLSNQENNNKFKVKTID